MRQGTGNRRGTRVRRAVKTREVALARHVLSQSGSEEPFCWPQQSSLAEARGALAPEHGSGYPVGMETRPGRVEGHRRDAGTGQLAHPPHTMAKHPARPDHMTPTHGPVMITVSLSIFNTSGFEG